MQARTAGHSHRFLLQRLRVPLGFLIGIACLAGTKHRAALGLLVVMLLLCIRTMTPFPR